MDYKKLIKSRSARAKILRMLRFVPDEAMVKLQYKIKTGRRLDLKAPRRYTEKLQWYKLNYRDPAMIECVDKYDVRDYVRSRGLENILNTCYGVYDTAEAVDFDALPGSFVLKDTLGGGGNAVIIVRDKEKMDADAVREELRGWIRSPHHVRGGGREWPYYSGKPHRIIAERYVEADPDKGGLTDYKFFCFDGRPAYLYVVADRRLGKSAAFGIFSKDFERLPVRRTDERPLEGSVEKPENYEQMLRIAARLSAGFPHARVDLYNDNGRVLFGEITFFDGSGYMRFDPDQFDFVLGEAFKLPE